MRKFLLLLMGFVSFFGISSVKADTFNASSFYDNFDDKVEILENYKDNINHLISLWEANHTSEYPYYFIVLLPLNSGSDVIYYDIVLYATKDNKINLGTSGMVLSSVTFDGSKYLYSYSYSIKDNEYISNVLYVPSFNSNGYSLLKSNTTPIYNNGTYSYSQGGTVYEYDFDKIVIPDYTSTKYDLSFNSYTVSLNESLPTLESLIDNSYFTTTSNYVEVNLNNYAYIALSLKNYNKKIEDNYSEFSNIIVKGQLCATPVYDRGMTERKDVLTGSKVQACSEYTENYKTTRFYILKSDIENNAIYYLKAYDTSKENFVKIDTNYFEISYITEENKDNPEVKINGKLYPTLAYDSLTDTSTKSEDEGYISGVSCAVGDFNCYNEYNDSNIFKDIFDKPLEALKSVWSAIINVFEIIKWFILLLPPTLQSFLYLSFMIAIVLGIIKIVL